MIIGKMKTYALIAGGALLSALFIAVKFLAGQNASLRVENKIAKAKEKHTIKVMERDSEIDEQTDTHLAEVAKEIEDGKHPESLLNPNDGWVRNDDSKE